MNAVDSQIQDLQNRKGSGSRGFSMMRVRWHAARWWSIVKDYDEISLLLEENWSLPQKSCVRT